MKKAFCFLSISTLLLLFAGCMTLGDNIVMRSVSQNPNNWIASALVDYAESEKRRLLARDPYTLSVSELKDAAKICEEIDIKAAIHYWLMAAVKGDIEGYYCAGDIFAKYHMTDIALQMYTIASEENFKDAASKADTMKIRLKNSGEDVKTILAIENQSATIPAFLKKYFSTDKSIFPVLRLANKPKRKNWVQEKTIYYNPIIEGNTIYREGHGIIDIDVYGPGRSMDEYGRNVRTRESFGTGNTGAEY